MSQKTSKETPIMKSIQIALVKLFGARLFRNNVGLLFDRTGRPVRYGLCNGSSDLIGWKSLVVKPEMIGRRIAVFTAIEVKADEKKEATPEQKLFLHAVKQSGGIALLSHSEENAIEQMKEVTKTW